MGSDNIQCKYKVKAQSNYNMSRLAIIQLEKQFTILLSWKNLDDIQNLGAFLNILSTSLK